MSFKEFKEHSVRAGLGTALCYMLPSESKYHILAAVENLPAISSAVNTIEYSTTTNKSITKIKGKKGTESVEINIPYNLDTINICTELKDQNIRFAYIDLNDFSGQEFQADVDYHLAEIGTDSVKTIMLELVISNVEDNVTEDLYDLYMDTLSFNEDIPAVYRVNKDSSASSTALTVCKVTVDDESATLTAVSDSTGVLSTVEIKDGKLQITLATSKVGSAIITITASKTDGTKAKNTRRIKVIVE